MRIIDAIDQYSYAILHLSDQYQIWIIARLKQFAVWCDLQTPPLQLEQIKATEIRKYIDYLGSRPNETNGKPLSTHTVHGHARALRTFLNWCSQEDDGPMEGLVSEKTPRKMRMPKVEQKVLDIFTPEQIRAMFASAEREYTPALTARDKAMLSLLIDTGVRASELCTLTMSNVHLDPHKDSYIQVLGKGKKEREVGLGKKARTALHKYITRYRKVPAEEKRVFLSRFNKPFTTNGLDQMLYRLAGWAHLTGMRVSAHKFRHTYAVEYLKNGGDIYKLSRLMGHTSIQVTMGYLKALQNKDARQGSEGSVLDNL